MILPYVGGDIRAGSEFRLTAKPHVCARATFIAQDGDKLLVTRRLTDILHLPDDTPTLANWHGQYRTDSFALTIGELRALASAYPGLPTGHA